MATIGYLNEVENAHTMNLNLRLLRRAGVSLSSITIGGDIMQVIDSLSCGDCLIVLSVSELSPQVARQMLLLKRIADNGIIFRPLNKIDTTPELAHENFMDRLLRDLGVRRTGTHHNAATLESPAGTDLKVQVIKDCMKLYSGLKKNIKTICDKADIYPRTLCDFLRSHNLPGRREAKVKLNPLCKSGFQRVCSEYLNRLK